MGLKTYTRPIRIYAIILVILADLVKIVFIQLPNKRCEIAVFEMLWEDKFCEFLVLWGLVLAVLLQVGRW